MKTQISEILGIEYPIIQGGMAWEAEHNLATAVSNAGGLGIIGAASAPACVVREEIRKCKELTDKPFDVNIMLLNPKTDEAWRQHLCLAHRQYRWEPGLWLRKNPLCTPIINKKSLRLRISIPQLQKRQIHFYDLTAATISAVVFGLFME